MWVSLHASPPYRAYHSYRAHFSGSLNRRSQAQLAPDLVRFLRTFLTTEPKTGRASKRKRSAANTPKGQK